MKTAFIIVGSFMILLSALSHFCIFMEKQERDLAGESFEMEYTTASWLLPLVGVSFIFFGIFL